MGVNRSGFHALGAHTHTHSEGRPRRQQVRQLARNGAPENWPKRDRQGDDIYYLINSPPHSRAEKKSAVKRRPGCKLSSYLITVKLNPCNSNSVNRPKFFSVFTSRNGRVNFTEWGYGRQVFFSVPAT